MAAITGIILCLLATAASGNHQHHHHHHDPNAPPMAETVVVPLAESFHPFSPRFQVERIEVSDQEWQNELTDKFLSSGLLSTGPQGPGSGNLLRVLPQGVVNINYAIHNCVHLGTELPANDTVEPPGAISYPATDPGQLHTLVMLDHDRADWLHWLVVNIPGSKVKNGQTIKAYVSPMPAFGTGLHRFVFLVMKQQRGRLFIEDHFSSMCDYAGRERFNLRDFQIRHDLSEPFAVNYFLQEYDPSLGNLLTSCTIPGF